LGIRTSARTTSGEKLASRSSASSPSAASATSYFSSSRMVRRASRLYALGIPWALLGMALPAVTLVIASAGVVGR